MVRSRKDEPELTARNSEYVETFSERPPWWRDANYDWSGRGRTIPPTLFGKEQ